MTIRKIARMGHPVLRRRAQPIDMPTDPEIQRLIGDMVETMIDAGGAGLAAPQVHEDWRLVIFRAPSEHERGRGPDPEAEQSGAGKADPREFAPLTVLINPEIEPVGTEMESGWEGCLSVPGLRGLVPRHAQIRYRGLDQRGEPFSREAHGFHARVVQHECDHLDGILYPQRMDDLSLLVFDTEFPRLMAELGDDEDGEPA